MRISRDARSQLYRMQQVRDSLTQELQREPSGREIAAAMKITYDELLSLLDQRDMTEVQSLSAATSSDEDAQQLEEKLGMIDEGFEQVEQSEWMQWVLRQLTPVEQRLMHLRYVDRLGQRDCARELGVSQMQISRMERRMLARLRETAEPWQH